jgi:hypothetical protein
VSSGPYKSFDYKGDNIQLSHRANKDFYDSPDMRRTMLIIQALKALGKDGIDRDVIDELDQRLSDSDVQNLYENTKYGISWIFKIAKTLHERRMHGQRGIAVKAREGAAV